jgi:uncharacterized DUF497 family protein
MKESMASRLRRRLPFSMTSARLREDTDSFGEQRFVSLGMSAAGNLLVIVYTWRPATIRLISAWRANARQRKAYAQG